MLVRLPSYSHLARTCLAKNVTTFHSKERQKKHPKRNALTCSLSVDILILISGYPHYSPEGHLDPKPFLAAGFFAPLTLLWPLLIAPLSDAAAELFASTLMANVLAGVLGAAAAWPHATHC